MLSIATKAAHRRRLLPLDSRLLLRLHHPVWKVYILALQITTGKSIRTPVALRRGILRKFKSRFESNRQLLPESDAFEALAFRSGLLQ